MIRANLKFFGWAYAATVLGLVGAFWLGWVFTETLAGALKFLAIGSILAALEISLSFDNAIVNANVLNTMDPKWQKRFLTWGILIAVFGMRIFFPLIVVAVAAHIGPINAVIMAVSEPHEYARHMSEAHLSIAAFGGTFLMMVALGFFIDREKECHWISHVEQVFKRCAAFPGTAVIIVTLIALGVAFLLDASDRRVFLISAFSGLVTFILVDLFGRLLDGRFAAKGVLTSGGLGAFLYLEVLDASFSFDGVIGAFALSQNLFLIAIGLGIGAMYVRSLTIMIVHKKTLKEFQFLEHGAFYSILALSLIMFTQTILHVPEVITGLIGVVLIGLSFISSVKYNRLKNEQ